MTARKAKLAKSDVPKDGISPFLKFCEATYSSTASASFGLRMAAFADSVVAKKLLAVWPEVDIELVNEEFEGWDAVNVSFNEWCKLAGIPPSYVNLQVCENLMRLNLVLPDNRVSPCVESFLKGV